jgi:hypothetical protein
MRNRPKALQSGQQKWERGYKEKVLAQQKELAQNSY